MKTKYNPEIHHRRSIRLAGYDYAQPGVYFVTLCVQDRLCLLGEIAHKAMTFSEWGRIAAQSWTWLRDQYPYVSLDVWVVMPNHLHGIIVLLDDDVGACHAASQRWVTRHAAYYAADNPILMGDDLYANQPLCEHILAHHLHFLFGCKPDSHKALYAALEERASEIQTVLVRKWNGKHSTLWTYRYCANVPLRAGEAALLVNWCELHITHAETGTTLYHHTWVTDLEITADNLAEIVMCARAHWKVENENNNVLKNRGYHLAHNFGHGQQYLAQTLLTLNLLAFLLHTVMHLSNKIYRRIRKTLGRREAFFNDLRALLRYLVFDSWADLLTFMAIRLEIIPAPD